MEIINVLVTGSGAPGIVGTIYSLRVNPNNTKFKIISTDIKLGTIGESFADKFYQLPAPEHEDYLEKLIEVINVEGVKVILPQTTREIEFLSKNKKIFSDMGVGIVVSDYNAIENANDKYLIIKACEACNVPYPQYYLINSVDKLVDACIKLGYPEKKVVVKPRLSNGLRGVRILTTNSLTFDYYINEKPSGLEIDLDSFLKVFESVEAKDFPELLVTEYMPGEEYSVDVYGKNDSYIVLPRLRKAIRSGISFETIIDLKQKDIINYSEKLARYLDLKHCFGFQFKLDDNGVPKILESNPRIQGTMVASSFSGFNMIYASVMDILGKPLDLENINLEDGVRFNRFWGGIGYNSLGSFII